MNLIFCVLTDAIIYVLMHQIIFLFHLLKYSLFFQVLTSSYRRSLYTFYFYMISHMMYTRFSCLFSFGYIIFAPGYIPYIYPLRVKKFYRNILWRDSRLNFCDRLNIWQAPRQQRCRDGCQISEGYGHYNIESHGVETSRYLLVRRLTA